MKNELIEYLSGFVTPHKLNLFEEIVENRTNYITVVLENIYQPHNASAVLRTCDCFGINKVHIIEKTTAYKVNPDIALGASKWLDLKKYNRENANTTLTIQELKKQGYRIVATTPHKNDVMLEDFDLKKGKTALLFGTEMQGLTNEAIEKADEFLKIPMFGFTESYNISVSAAICLHHLTWKLHNSDINWQLSEEEKQEIKLNWLRTTIKHSEQIEQRYFNDKK